MTDKTKEGLRLEEELSEEKVVFKGRVLNFHSDTVRLPNGKTSTREYMEHPGAVALLPVLPDGRIIFVRQYRFPVKEITLEIPAGKMLSKSDDPVFRARAELEEETGYTTKRLNHLMDFWPSSSFSDEKLRIFSAEELVPGRSHPDEDEFINTEILRFEEAWKIFCDGKIKDAKTIIALQAWKIHLMEKK